MGNLTTAKERLGGVAGLDAGGTDTISSLTDVPAVFVKLADDSLPADATANFKFWTNPYDFTVRVVAGSYNANGTITANNTNFATIQLKTDDGAASTPAVAAAVSTTTSDSGNVAAGISEAMTLTPANVAVPPGGSLYVAITKSGSGVVVRAGTIMARLERL